VGMKGSRVQAVIRELRGEKIDIVQYDDDPSQYVRNALNPATINRVAIADYETREMEVIVAEDQLSLAIGKRGQNVRLASKLVGWSLDIMSEAEKKAEVEAEMERMAAASQELACLPGIDEDISSRLLDAGFRTVEEVSLASMEDLTAIDGVDEEAAIAIHDAAEEALAQLVQAAELEAEEAARAAELQAEEAADDGDEDEEAADLEDDDPDETEAAPDEDEELAAAEEQVGDEKDPEAAAEPERTEEPSPASLSSEVEDAKREE